MPLCQSIYNHWYENVCMVNRQCDLELTFIYFSVLDPLSTFYPMTPVLSFFFSLNSGIFFVQWQGLLLSPNKKSRVQLSGALDNELESPERLAQRKEPLCPFTYTLSELTQTWEKDTQRKGGADSLGLSFFLYKMRVSDRIILKTAGISSNRKIFCASSPQFYARYIKG